MIKATDMLGFVSSPADHNTRVRRWVRTGKGEARPRVRWFRLVVVLVRPLGDGKGEFAGEEVAGK